MKLGNRDNEVRVNLHSNEIKELKNHIEDIMIKDFDYIEFNQFDDIIDEVLLLIFDDYELIKYNDNEDIYHLIDNGISENIYMKLDNNLVFRLINDYIENHH